MASEDRFVQDTKVKLTPAAWSASPPMLRRLQRDGVAAWAAHIDRQMTRKDIEGLASEQIMAAQEAGRLDRLLATGS